MSRLPSLIHTTTSLLAILASYLWLQTSFLSSYSLQAFSAAMLIYFILKRLNRSKLHHIAPAPNTLEMPLMTFAVLLLIGATGVFDSLFFPLTYLYLFFLVLSTNSITSIITTLGLIVFYSTLAPQMTTHEWSSILTMPILLALFLFSKRQQEDVIRAEANQERECRAKELLRAHNQKQAIEIEKLSNVKEQETMELVNLESFLQSFLKPKLEYMSKLSQDSDSHLVIKAQVELMHKRVNELLKP